MHLNEDLYPSGDITSRLIKKKPKEKLKLISNQRCYNWWFRILKQTFNLIDKKIKFSVKKKKDLLLKKGSVIAIIEGNIKHILIGERVVLNFYPIYLA